MNIDELTVGQAKELAQSNTRKSHPYEIGGLYFIRTVSHHLTGRLEAIYEKELVLSDAAWIAEDGRFMQAVASAEFAEVEPFPPERTVIVGREAIIDAVAIPKLPTEQK